MGKFIIPLLLFGAIVACQGPMGDTGFTGAQGPAGITGATGAAGADGQDEVGALASYSSSSCVLIAGTAFYGVAKSNGFAISYYSNCHSPVVTLTQTKPEFWLDADSVALFRAPHGIEVLSIGTD